MATAPTSISSVPEALEAVQELKGAFFGRPEWRHHKFPFGLWFRGHSRGDIPLEPQAFRNKTKITDSDTGAWDETNVYDVLRLRVPLQRRVYKSAFEWLCLMQHYDLPTRLLDWSESILTALYFAAWNEDDRSENGELIVLNAKRLNRGSKPYPTISTPSDGHVVIRAEMATTRSAHKLSHKRTVRRALEEEGLTQKEGWMHDFCTPVAVFPNRLNDRMTFQYSMFTLHGGKHYVPQMIADYYDDMMPPPISLADIDARCPAEKPLLKRFIVPFERKQKLLDELFILGVHEGTLFPEVEHQRRYMKRLWWYSDDSSGDPDEA